jgi:amino acid transporter
MSDLNKFGYKQELKRSLTLKDLVVYGLVWAVPIAPFVVFGYVAEASKGMVGLTYLLTMVGMLLTANSYARLSAEFPVAGSSYFYVSKGMNGHLGFLIGWSVILDYLLVPPLMYLFGALALQAIMPGVPLLVWVVLFIGLATIINYRGVELTMKVNKYILGGQLIVLAWFLIACLIGISQGVEGSSVSVKPLFDGGNFSVGLIMGAISVAVLNFIGTDAITTLSEETKGGSKTIGWAMVLTILFLGLLFVTQTVVASWVWPNYATFGSLDTSIYEIALLVGGKALHWAVTLSVVVAIGFACSINAQASSSRLIYAMSRDKKLPRALSKVHPKYQTPYVSNIVAAVLSLIVCTIFASKSAELTLLVNFGALLGFSIVNVTCIYYFLVRQKSKNYFAHLIMPLLGLSIVGFAFCSLDKNALTLGCVWLAVGLIYMLYLKYVSKVQISLPQESGI